MQLIVSGFYSENNHAPLFLSWEVLPFELLILFLIVVDCGWALFGNRAAENGGQVDGIC